MKRILGILSLAAACLPVCAQYQLENAGFESWESVSYDNGWRTISGEEPFHWNSFITGSGGLKSTACQGSQLFPVTDVRPGTTGTKSAKLTAKKVFITTYAQGNMTTGQINMGSTTASDATGNYNATRENDNAYNQKITGRPDSMVVWLKFYTTKSSYRAKANSILHTSGYYQDPEVNTLTATVIAKAVNLDIEPLNKWKRYSIPFSYSSDDRSLRPAYALVSFSTNKTPGTGTKDDALYVDDLEYIYNSELKKFTYNGTTIDAPKAGETVWFTACPYDPAIVPTFVTNAQGGSVSYSVDANNLMTVTVKGDDYSVNASNYHTYYVQFPYEKTYTGTLGVGNGSTYGKGATFYAKLLVESETKRSLKFENITLENAAGKQGIGTLYVPNVTVNGTSVTGTYNGTFSAGSDAAISSWQGSAWGTQQCNVSLTLSASNSITGTITCPKLKMVFANSQTLNQSSNVMLSAGTYNVTINRTFAQGWNTLCLPFSMTPAEIGAKAAQEFSSVSEGKTLNFAAVSQMQANVPYLVFFENATASPFYYCGAMQAPSAQDVTHSGITFSGNFTADKNMQGFYGIATGTDGHQRILLGSAGATLPAMAAFFSGTQSLANMSLRMEGENMTDIEAIQTTENEAQTDVYTLQGTRIQPATKGARLPKGIYIINGKKVIVK